MEKFEQFSGSQNSKESQGLRAGRARSEELAFLSDNDREGLEREYKEKQTRIIELKTNLKQGNELAMTIKDRVIRDRGNEIGREITEEIENLSAELEQIGRKIVKLGGSVSEYRVQ